MKDLLRILKYLARYRWTLAGAITCAILSATFFGSAVTMVKPLMATMVAPRPATAAPDSSAARPNELLPGWANEARARAESLVAPARDWVLRKPYVRVPLVMVLLYSLKAILAFVADFTFRRVGMRATMQIRQELYSRTLRQSDVFFLRHNTGEMISRILSDVARLQTIFGSDIAQMGQAVPTAIAMLVVAFLNSWQITLACLVIVPVFAVAAGQLGRRVKKSTRRSQETSAVLVAGMSEAILGRRVVQAYGAEHWEDARFNHSLERNLRQELRVARVATATPALMEILGVLVLALLVTVAASLTRRGALDGQAVFVCLLAVGVVFTQVRRLSQLATLMQQAMAAGRRIFEILDEPIMVQDPVDPRPLPAFAREIRIEGVRFDYGRGPVLHGIDMTIRAGEVHAFVGGSGAGKTTLAMLVPRFLDPSEGRVTIDGVDLREVAISDLRAQIALVSQETHLFDDTVRANIAYGQPDAPPEAVERAARAAHAHDFIARMPQGYETRLGERGTQLSAGQRQRLAIARAFLKDAPILILDEATSALDSVSEHEVQKALLDLLAGRTAILIAHRLSTVAGADVIHVLESGRVVESGSHAELLARGGAYARLHQLQQT